MIGDDGGDWVADGGERRNEGSVRRRAGIVPAPELGLGLGLNPGSVISRVLSRVIKVWVREVRCAESPETVPFSSMSSEVSMVVSVAWLRVVV
jgi:hypothetical protein